MKNIIYYIKIVRPINLIILAATQIILKYSVFDHIFHQNDLESKWSVFNFMIFVLITIIITASGNVINDYYDQETDELHEHKNKIVGKLISPVQTLSYYYSLVLLGGILAIYLAIRLEFMSYLYFYPVAVFSLFFYSKKLKGTTLIGNLLISLFISLACLVIWLLDYDTYQLLIAINPIAAHKQINLICGLSIIVFLINLSREVVKDIEDIKADKSSGIQTTAVTLGVTNSKIISVVIQAILVVFLLIWSIYSRFNVYSTVYLWILLIPLLLLQINKTIKANGQKDYKKTSSLHKVIMGVGLMYIILNLLSNSTT